MQNQMKLYHHFWNCFGYWNHYDNDAAPTVATITPASAAEGSLVVFNFTSNPSAGYNTYLCID
jgi:hypothetical protein